MERYHKRPKKIVCIDCDKEVYLDSYMDTKTCRCDECQKVYRNKYMRELMQNKREPSKFVSK